MSIGKSGAKQSINHFEAILGHLREAYTNIAHVLAQSAVGWHTNVHVDLNRSVRR